MKRGPHGVVVSAAMKLTFSFVKVANVVKNVAIAQRQIVTVKLVATGEIADV